MSSAGYSVEPARPEDRDAIREIVERYEPPEAASVLGLWWEACPHSFRVVRDRSAKVVGVSAEIKADAVPYRLVRADPILSWWRDHLRRHPLPTGQRALCERYELSRDHGDTPSPVQAALWLEIKRMYMEMRPHIGRLYSVHSNPSPYVDALTTLGFSLSPERVRLGRYYTCLWLDFGPESVDGWLARLAASELGIRPDEVLEPANREVLLDGVRVALSPLEFGVFHCLYQRRGTAISRAELIEKVWRHSYLGGSNVVDVVIRSLRRKLGQKASAIETVRGTGYRLAR